MHQDNKDHSYRVQMCRSALRVTVFKHTTLTEQKLPPAIKKNMEWR